MDGPVFGIRVLFLMSDEKSPPPELRPLSAPEGQRPSPRQEVGGTPAALPQRPPSHSSSESCRCRDCAPPPPALAPGQSSWASVVDRLVRERKHEEARFQDYHKRKPTRFVKRARDVTASIADSIAQLNGDKDALRQVIKDLKQDKQDGSVPQGQAPQGPPPPPPPHVQEHARMIVGNAVRVQVPASAGKRWWKTCLIGAGLVGLGLVVRSAVRYFGGDSTQAYAAPAAAAVVLGTAVALPHAVDTAWRLVPEPVFYPPVEPRLLPSLPTIEQVVRESEALPSIPLTVGPISRTLRSFDFWVQEFLVHTGRRDHYETGKMEHLFTCRYAEQDETRPTNVHANAPANVVVEVSVSMVHNRHLDQVQLLVYSREIVGQVLQVVGTSTNEDRRVQCLDLATRTTNLNYPSRIWPAVQLGSGLYSHMMACTNDVRVLRIHNMMRLNSASARTASSTGLVIALEMVLPPLLLVAADLWLSAMMRSTKHNRVGLCRHVSDPPLQA